MVGDQTDMLARLKAMLPLRWFPDATPVLDGVLTGFAATWATLYNLLGYVRSQTRLSTTTDGFLDMAGFDYFGPALARRAGETDDAFRARLQLEMRRERGTRPALATSLTDLTGRFPDIFEFTRPADTGCWNVALGYGVAGGWGSLNLPFQALVTAYRPQGGGAVGVGDADIRAAITSVLPAATTAWTRIES